MSYTKLQRSTTVLTHSLIQVIEKPGLLPSRCNRLTHERLYFIQMFEICVCTRRDKEHVNFSIYFDFQYFIQDKTV